MSASLEELRPIVDQLLEAMGERMPGNGCLELHFHEGLLIRAQVNRVYRPSKRGTVLDRRAERAQDSGP